jgi:hypothetical protein
MPRRRSRPEQLASELESWNCQELKELIAIAEALLDLQETATALDEPKRRADGSPVGKKGGAGSIELKLIKDKATGKTYGPYRYLRYWGTTKDGKRGLKSVYLGKDS